MEPPTSVVDAPDSAVGPASLAGMAERGRFVFYFDGTALANVDHQWEADGRHQLTSTIDYAGQTIVRTLRVDVDDTGSWSRIETEGANGKHTFAREGLTVTATHGGVTERVEIAEGTVLFSSPDNISPALVRHVVARYDAAKGGTQSFPAYVPGAPPTQVMVTREPDQTHTIDGADTELHRWRLQMLGMEIEVLAMPDDRVLLWRLPKDKAAFVREGYEALLVLAEDDPLLSAPTHEVVVDDEVAVPMRDGTVLRADVYRPDAPGRHPTVVIRTPYKKEIVDMQARYFARRGYVVVVQDVRGRFASEGEWVPFMHEKHDGYDTIEWAAAQAWSTGKVGMLGASYLGWVQWLAAVERPPHLVTIVPNVAPPDPLYNAPYEHGVVMLAGSLWWHQVVAEEATADISGAAIDRISKTRYAERLRTLPVIELDEAVLGGPNEHWRQWMSHPSDDGYWDGASYLDELSRVDLPVLNQSGWFDDDAIGSKLTMQRMTALGREHQHIVMGPWGHTDRATRVHQDWDFGPEAVSIDLLREYVRWFDHWLLGVDNGIDRQPKVRLFAMGSNRWLSGDSYPLPGTKPEKWYLRSDGHANGLDGDGTLGREPAGAATDVYVYDPGDPTPNPRYFEPPRPGQEPEPAVAAAERAAQPDRVLRERDDILVYVSEPFVEDTTFAGPVSAVLHAATTARDTDWYVTLVELDEHGKALPLSQGKLRARYRKSMRKPTLLRPGQIERYELDLWHTGITVRKGHRLRVEVASGMYPNCSRNLNTGGNNETDTEFVSATQTIHHSKRHPSYVVLPRVPNPR